MRRLYVGLALLTLTAAGCQEAKCPPETRKLGTRCIPLADSDDAVNAPEGGESSDDAGAEDDSDAQVATGDGGWMTPAVCLVDRDGDGYGEDGTEEPCTGTPPLPGDCDDDDADIHPAAHDACSDGVDNDCDGEVDEGSVEQCNGEDDDCDGAVDNGFLCMAGQTEVACTTECGTQGTRMCSESCEAAATNQCVPPAEVCNGIDDDCDGAIDSGLWAQLSSATRAITLTSVPGAQATPLRLLRRPGGGAWLLYRDGSELRSQLLDANGHPSGGSRLIVAKIQAWQAITTGDFVVLGTAHHEGSRIYGVIRLLRASDLAPIDDYQLSEVQGDCSSYLLLDLAAYVSQSGSLNISLIQGRGTGTYSATDPTVCLGSLQGKMEAIVLSRSAQGIWTAPVTALQYGNLSAFGGAVARLIQMPCRDEWLFVENPEQGRWLASRIGTNGVVVAKHVAEVDAFILLDLAHTTSCNGSIEEVAVLSARSPSTSQLDNQLTRWRFDKDSGALLDSKQLDLPGVQLGSATASARGNEVLIVGIGDRGSVALIEYPLASDRGMSRSIRLSPDASASDRQTAAELAFITGVSGIRTTGIVDAGNSYVIAVSSADTPATRGYREAGDTKAVGVMTYAIGCP